MATIERAVEIAAQAHRGQLDKSGKPYLLHPLRLMLRMEDETEMIAAILHDVVEDSPWTLEGLRAEGFSDTALQAVDCLTHREHESYEVYVKRVKSNPIARRVKLADLEDNMNLRRLNKVTNSDLSRLEKYHRAWLALTGEEE
jgi:(p)ppGpp synthase/HD superfamily hydrolase